jgi:orotate phosphoribosyltransferase
MHQDLKKQLIRLLVEKSFKYSQEPIFKLASGRMSNYYIDCRTVTHSAEGKHLIGSIIYEMVRDDRVQAVGGLTMGADPIACSVSYAAFLNGCSIASFSIRKEPKGHGLGKQVEGDVRQGDRVAIVEDVITTGASTIKAIEAARREGLEVVKVIALVDRQEGGREEILKHIPAVEAVCGRAELLEACRDRPA